jgi:hypothetical protein
MSRFENIIETLIHKQSQTQEELEQAKQLLKYKSL